MNKMIIKRRILIWIIIILVALNVSIMGTIFYNSHTIKHAIHNNRAEFLKERISCEYIVDELRFDDEQKKAHRLFRRNYMKEAEKITIEMQHKRIEIMNELESEAPDTLYLHALSKEIGRLHAELKQTTINYYLNLKSTSNDKQKRHLSKIFNNMTNRCDMRKRKSNNCKN